MNDRYEVKVASAPGVAPFTALEAIIRKIPMNQALHSVIPYTDRDGTLSFVVILRSLS